MCYTRFCEYLKLYAITPLFKDLSYFIFSYLLNALSTHLRPTAAAAEEEEEGEEEGGEVVIM